MLSFCSREKRRSPTSNQLACPSLAAQTLTGHLAPQIDDSLRNRNSWCPPLPGNMHTHDVRHFIFVTRIVVIVLMSVSHDCLRGVEARGIAEEPKAGIPEWQQDELPILERFHC